MQGEYGPSATVPSRMVDIIDVSIFLSDES